MQARSLFNGLLGVKTHTQAMHSVADNLANLSTPGYKHTRMNFDDLLSQQIANGSPSATPTLNQVGHGSRVKAQNMMIQGAFEFTDNTTDLGISGHGFFTVSDPVTADVYYTRAGEYVLDKDGYMVLPSGHRLMGYGVDADGELVIGNTISDIQIPLDETDANATSEIGLVVNLSADDTKEFDQDVALDPTDPDTFNYAVSHEVYDEEGNSYSVATYYQKVDNYVGDAPDGSSIVWKAETYQTTSSGVTANPAAPDNQYYLHFDTNGELVGTSGSGVPGAEALTVDGAEVAAAGSQVSNRVGETFGYTGEGGAQTYVSYQTADVSGWGAGDTLTVTVGAAATNYTGYADGEALAMAVNADTATTGLWADYDSSTGEIALYSDGSSPAELAFTGGITPVSNTLSQLIGAVNNGRSAGGTMYIDLTAGWAAGDTVSVGGAGPWTYDPLGAGDFQDLSELETLIAAQGYTVGRLGGANTGSLFIEAAAGTAGNSVAMSATSAGTVAISDGGSLAGGMDGTATTDVAASSVASGGGVALHLERQSPGAGASINVAAGDLGENLATPLDFAAYTVTSEASGGSSGATAGSQIELTFALEQTDPETGAVTVVNQTVTFDYDPGGDPNNPDIIYAGSTSSGGLSSLFLLEQDGAPIGYLQGLEILKDGAIIGHYSNGESATLAGVALTDFISPEELMRMSENLWEYDQAAGEAVVGQPGDEALAMGVVNSGFLETSTVDVAEQFVQMINYQRAFQANSKSIITSDDMLKIAINLKR